MTHDDYSSRRTRKNQGAAGFSPRESTPGNNAPQYERSRRLKPAAPCHLRGFSLLEIMIATIILGFGLLMIGAVLPIAWKGSLEASELTRAEGASRTAKYYVQKKCRVDGLRDLFDPNNDPLFPGGDGPDSLASRVLLDRDGVSYSFLGDYDTIDDIDGDDIPDPLVHALHLENWAMNPDALFLCDSNTANDLSVPEAPIVLELSPGYNQKVGIPADLLLVGACSNYPLGIGAPVIKLRDRLYPPIPDTLTPEDVNQWRELLTSRRYAWAVFHRLARVPRSPTDPRYFHMYYVTLRRGNNTSRFARQSSVDGIVPFAPPIALPDTEDVMFPIAWRVPLLVIESQSPGVPAIAFAGAINADVDAFLAAGLDPPLSSATPIAPVDNDACRVADMFPRGSFFIDELNGNVYRVSQREYIDNAAGQTNRLARLTLDTEVTIADLLVPLASGPLVGTERNRIVWVFPPSVAAGIRNPVNFTGGKPVVDIRVETLTLMP
ncbi:MAG: hypothetical protein IID41_13490 [Planctomycetes bacterium]|nr:hypothetical protein [Planctomycetota bacterium]